MEAPNIHTTTSPGQHSQLEDYIMATIERSPTSTDTTLAVAPTRLKSVITTRQFTFMALGSSIGAGFLLATGQVLAASGPAPLLLAFAVVGFAVWITMCSLGELATNFPIQGSFYEYSVRFISPPWGFAMGWNYVLNLIFVIPFEIIMMVMCVRLWKPDIQAAYLVLGVLLSLVIIHSFGSKWFAEIENVFGILKMGVITTFSVTAICICARAVSTDTRPARELAYNSWPTEAFKNGAPGLLFAFSFAAMAYGGNEMLGLTATECRSPRRVMSLASRLVAGRITLLYILPVLLLGLVLKIDLEPAVSDDNNGHSSYETLVSPFVLAVSKAKIPVLPDIMNGVIAVAIFSMANASIFASSRALQAISARGMGPPFCASVVRRNTPIGALTVVFSVSLLAFTASTNHPEQIFVWLLSTASCSNYLTWSSICVSQIRCRLALKKQGRSLDDDLGVYRAPLGIAGSAIAIVVFAFGLVAQITAAAKSPLPSPPPVASSFVGLVVVVVFWVSYMAYKRDCTLLLPLDQIKFDEPKDSEKSSTEDVAEVMDTTV